MRIAWICGSVVLAHRAFGAGPGTSRFERGIFGLRVSAPPSISQLSPRHRSMPEAGAKRLRSERVFFWNAAQVTDVAAIARQIEPEVKSLGYELVRVAMIGETSDPTLQVMAERPD